MFCEFQYAPFISTTILGIWVNYDSLKQRMELLCDCQRIFYNLMFSQYVIRFVDQLALYDCMRRPIKKDQLKISITIF